MSSKNNFTVVIWLTLCLTAILVACTPEIVVSPTAEASTPIVSSPTLPTSLLLTLTPSVPAPIMLSPAPSVQTGPMYDFENFANGWMSQVDYSAMACIQVSNSTAEVKDGQYSLEMQMNLIGNDEQNNRGEAWVDMRNYPPSTAQIRFIPLDLNNSTITMWVYAPTGAVGDKTKPNGLQIFVKDVHFNGSYGTWTNVVENEWVQLSFTVGSSAVENGYMERGFDPSQIIALGLKMGAGEGSIADYQGPIYVDTVDW